MNAAQTPQNLKAQDLYNNFWYGGTGAGFGNTGNPPQPLPPQPVAGANNGGAQMGPPPPIAVTPAGGGSTTGGFGATV
jgi:hypothetical protein